MLEKMAVNLCIHGVEDLRRINGQTNWLLCKSDETCEDKKQKKGNVAHDSIRNEELGIWN